MISSTSLIWRRIPERYRLLGSHCVNCDTDYFPKRIVCLNCRRKGVMEEKKMPEQGKIFSITRVHSPPSGFEHSAPYLLAVIELSNGVRILSQLVESNGACIDDKVEMVFRKVFEDGKQGIIAYGFKFKVMK